MTTRPFAQTILALPLVLITSGPAPAAMLEMGRAPVEDVWQPATTPPGGTSWKTFEATRLNDRTDPKTRMIYTRPTFPPAIRALAGKQIKVAGWMMPLENGARQKHFVLLGYPPGCPFHMHAMPNQFIEVYSAVPVTGRRNESHRHHRHAGADRAGRERHLLQAQKCAARLR